MYRTPRDRKGNIDVAHVYRQMRNEPGGAMYYLEKLVVAIREEERAKGKE